MFQIAICKLADALKFCKTALRFRDSELKQCRVQRVSRAPAPWHKPGDGRNILCSGVRWTSVHQNWLDLNIWINLNQCISSCASERDASSLTSSFQKFANSPHDKALNQVSDCFNVSSCFKDSKKHKLPRWEHQIAWQLSCGGRHGTPAEPERRQQKKDCL